MPNFRVFDQLTCATNSPLANPENRLLPWANVGNPPVVINGVDFMWCTFGVVASHAFTFSCEGAMVGSFAAFDTLFSIAVIAGTYTEPYALPAPKGASGFIVLPRPFLRFRAQNTAGVAHTSTRIFIRVWSP